MRALPSQPVSPSTTMTIQIAVLAVVFLAERLEPLQLIGLLLAAAGAAVVQVAPVLRSRYGR